MFYSGSVCHWKIGAPGEWTSNSIIKVQIKKLTNSKCYLNYGGSQTASPLEMVQEECTEGQLFELKYEDFSYEANIFLVSFAEYADSANTTA